MGKEVSNLVFYTQLTITVISGQLHDGSNLIFFNYIIYILPTSRDFEMHPAPALDKGCWEGRKEGLFCAQSTMMVISRWRLKGITAINFKAAYSSADPTQSGRQMKKSGFVLSRTIWVNFEPYGYIQSRSLPMDTPSFSQLGKVGPVFGNTLLCKN